MAMRAVMRGACELFMAVKVALSLPCKSRLYSTRFEEAPILEQVSSLRSGMCI